MLPKLEIHKCQVRKLENIRYHPDLVVENNRFLPSFSSLKGKDRKLVRPVWVEMDLPKGVTLITGKARSILEHLEGHSNKIDVDAVYASSLSDNRQKHNGY